jgi:hypothetical protein
MVEESMKPEEDEEEMFNPFVSKMGLYPTMSSQLPKPSSVNQLRYTISEQLSKEQPLISRINTKNYDNMSVKSSHKSNTKVDP